MMNVQRSILLAGIFGVLFLLLLEWNKFQQRQVAVIEPATNVTLSSPVKDDSGIPTAQESQSAVEAYAPTDRLTPTIGAHETSSLIEIQTDTLQLKIDRLGGDIVMASLPAYWAALDTPNTPFELLNRTAEKTYVSQSGLIGKNGTDTPDARPLFGSNQTVYRLADGESELVVDLVLPEKSGIKITKRFIFKRGEYLIDVVYLINNQSQAPWEASLFGQIKRDASIPTTKSTGLQPFLGAATTTKEEHYKKLKLKQISTTPQKESIEGGWVAFVQHYFISAWIGNADEKNNYSIRKLRDEETYILGYTGPTRVIAPGSEGMIGAKFYVGPKDTQQLEQIAPYLDLTVDYGWLWWVAKPIHWVLQKIYLVIQNWGWSIVALTLVIKIILFPLSHKAYISMGHMRKVAPKMNAIREQCGDNRQRLQEEMLKLYKTEKINPMGGCLPMLLQMPVFISLYWVLMESVELRHAPFVGWIHDLSVMDPYFCLPILMGISMYLQQQMNPAPPDPMQAKVMQFLPIVFTIMFLWFPAGLVLYWLVNNISSMAHQAYINRLVERGDA